jgi:hypothetical protein
MRIQSYRYKYIFFFLPLTVRNYKTQFHTSRSIRLRFVTKYLCFKIFTLYIYKVNQVATHPYVRTGLFLSSMVNFQQQIEKRFYEVAVMYELLIISVFLR